MSGKLQTLIIPSLASLVGCAPFNQGHTGPGGYSQVPVFADGWSGVAAGAAAGYCLAKHPYQDNSPGPFTADGYEKVASPGIVAAVRRNFVRERSTKGRDEGVGQTCEQACRQFGKIHEPDHQGKALRQQIGDEFVVSGIGDLASGIIADHDFYTDLTNVAGLESSANSYMKGGVAQADFCCCHVAPPAG